MEDKYMSNEKSCGAVVYRETDSGIEFLAIKSKAHGDWGFPKGHMEKGESEQETAKREVLEETGLNVTLVDQFRTTIEYTMPNGIAKEVVYFIGKALPEHNVRLQQEEIQEYRWLKFNEILPLISYKNTREVLIKAKKFLNP